MSYTREALDSFRAALADMGLEPDEIIADGEWHRCRTSGSWRKNGGYKLTPDLRVGWMRDFSASDKARRWTPKNAPKLTPAERQQMAQQAEDRKRKLETNKRRARGRAEYLWGKATKVRWHPYLSRKHVGAYDIKQLDDELLIPMRNADGRLMNLQRITRDGSKLFLEHGDTTGMFHLIGGPIRERVFLCEGYATGATVYQLVRKPVVVAFNCGNLLPVARAIRAKWPFADIIIAADDDWMTHNPVDNPGRTAAEDCQRELRCDIMLALPVFPKVEMRAKKDTDWNDLVLKAGPQYARKNLRQQIGE